MTSPIALNPISAGVVHTPDQAERGRRRQKCSTHLTSVLNIQSS